jgi:hypothetical protein
MLCAAGAGALALLDCCSGLLLRGIALEGVRALAFNEANDFVVALLAKAVLVFDLELRAVARAEAVGTACAATQDPGLLAERPLFHRACGWARCCLAAVQVGDGPVSTVCVFAGGWAAIAVCESGRAVALSVRDLGGKFLEVGPSDSAAYASVHCEERTRCCVAFVPWPPVKDTRTAGKGASASLT